ncbi:MAG: transposase [Candidatus Omnitrophota bacterium]
MRRNQRFMLAGSLLLLLASGEAAIAAQMYEGPISADFRDLALNAVTKSNDADAVNKGLDDLVKYTNTPDENSQTLAEVEALLGDVDANSYLFSQASLTKAKFLKRLGRGGEAIALFNDGIAHHWKNALLRYSESLIESGELDDACTLEYRRVVADEPYAFYRGEQEDFFIFITLLKLMKSDNSGAMVMDLVFPPLAPFAKHPQAHKIAQALCMANDGRFAEAVSALQTADAELAQGREAREDKNLDELLVFLKNSEVPATNNQAEREIRMAVLIRKIIYGNRSKEGALTQSVLMTIFRTLKRRGYNPIQTLAAALREYIRTGHLPPFPPFLTSDG